MSQVRTAIHSAHVPSKTRARRPDVSVIIPAYNEEAAIAGVLDEVTDALAGTQYDFEVLVVDDASTDRTAAVAEAWAAAAWPQRVRVLRRPVQAGAGAARKTGLRTARGDFVVMLDADGSYPASAIPQLLRYLPAYDQVTGARTSEQGSHPWLRRPAKWLIRKLACYLTGKQIADLNSGLKAFKRRPMLRFVGLVPDGFSCVTTMTLTFLTNGYSVKYVPVEYRPRIGKSKFHPIKDTAAYAATVLRMVLYFQPLKIFLPLAAAVLALGGVKGVWSFRATGSLQESDVILMVGGFLTAVVGLLADIIVAQRRM